MERIKAIINNRPEFIFLVFGLVFGVLFLVLTPMFEVPDEQAHFHRAVEVANGVFYNKEVPTLSAYDELLHQNLIIKAKIEHLTKTFHSVSGYSPVMYLTSALGVKFGALFKNPRLMFYLARLFNLFSWLALLYFAIKITPVFKWHFVLFALLPMSIYEGMSVSADSFVNGYLFLFFAYMFKLIFDKKEKLSRYEIIIYFLMTIISCLLKGCLIYPAFLFVFVKDKRKWIVSFIVILLSVVIGGLWATNNHIALGPEGNPEFQKAFILSHPFLYCKLFCKTLLGSSFFWIKGAIGILGWLNVRYPLWIYCLTLIVYSSSFLTIPAEKHISKQLRVAAAALILLYLLIVLSALFCTWTPVNFPRIGGFQGRYLICIFPLMFLFFTGNKCFFNFQQYIKYYLIYIFILLTYTCFLLHDVYQFS